MKKTYQNPTVNTVAVLPQQLLGDSEVKVGGSYNGTSPIESRQGNTFWDDDEE